MMQLKDKQIAVPVNPSTYPWMNLAYSFAGLTMDDSEVIRIDDPKAVQLGLAGRIPLAAPGGAVQIYQLQFQAGWKVVMSTNQMVKHVPTGTGTAVNNVLNYEPLHHHPALHRREPGDDPCAWSSAIYRTLDYIFGPKQEEALTAYAPYINAHAGSNLDAAAIKYIFEVVDPFYLWADQERIWTDRDYNLNYRNIYEYQLAEYRKKGTIEDRDYDLDDFFQAKNVWEELRDLPGQGRRSHGEGGRPRPRAAGGRGRGEAALRRLQLPRRGAVHGGRARVRVAPPPWRDSKLA